MLTTYIVEMHKFVQMAHEHTFKRYKIVMPSKIMALDVKGKIQS